MFFPVPPRPEPTEPAPPAPAPHPPSPEPAVEATAAEAEPTGPSPLASRELAEKLYSFAAEQLHSGRPASEVEQSLIRTGLSTAEAAVIVAALVRVRQDAGRRNMLHGALWCGGGLLVTLVSFQAGNGSFVLAWGAILFGAIQFFRGLSQSSGA